MDGKGCCCDKVLVKWRWKSIKYEEVYPHAYGSVSQARAGIARYLGIHNSRLPHQSLHGQPHDTNLLPPPTQLIGTTSNNDLIRRDFPSIQWLRWTSVHLERKFLDLRF